MIRVLSVPAGHPYVHHLGPAAGGSQVVRLPDPPVPGAPAGQWWPHPGLEPGWVREHAHLVDVVHVHFGFEHRTPEQLAEWTGVLREAGIPLVLTVHDLTNPHLVEQDGYARLLDVLVPAAQAVLTLTPAAAARIEDRWGRAATVVPHPHVAPLDRLGVPRPPRGDGPFTVGVSLKSLRANVDALPVLTALEAACRPGSGRRLRVSIHDDVLHPQHPRHDPAVASWLAAAGEHVRVHAHAPLPDDAFLDELAALDLAVLPYRHGTHSGWLEACYDVGTPVLAPDVGCYHDQHDCPTYRTGEHLAASLGAAVAAMHADPPRWQADPAARRAERAYLAAAHERVYADALAQVRR